MMATVRMLEEQEKENTFTENNSPVQHPLKKATVDLDNVNSFPSLPSSGAGKVAGSQPTTSTKSLASSWAQASKSSLAKNTVTDILEIAPSSLAIQKQFGAKAPTMIDVCKQLMGRTKTSIEMSTSKKTGKLTLLITGPPEEVPKVRRELLAKLTTKVYTLSSLRYHSGDLCLVFCVSRKL
jgi:hypothetical protein